VSKTRAAALAFVLVAAVSACGRFFATPIRDILDNPSAYEGKTVKVSGTVVDSANLFVIKFYHLQDATGKIAVVARKAVPQRGASVTATGTVHQAFALGDQNLTVILEEP
jgi:aspartyl/asparaginyl-tRNA synthetase